MEVYCMAQPTWIWKYRSQLLFQFSDFKSSIQWILQTPLGFGTVNRFKKTLENNFLKELVQLLLMSEVGERRSFSLPAFDMIQEDWKINTPFPLPEKWRCPFIMIIGFWADLVDLGFEVVVQEEQKDPCCWIVELAIRDFGFVLWGKRTFSPSDFHDEVIKTITIKRYAPKILQFSRQTF